MLSIKDKNFSLLGKICVTPPNLNLWHILASESTSRFITCSRHLNLIQTALYCGNIKPRVRLCFAPKEALWNWMTSEGQWQNVDVWQEGPENRVTVFFLGEWGGFAKATRKMHSIGFSSYSSVVLFPPLPLLFPSFIHPHFPFSSLSLLMIFSGLLQTVAESWHWDEFV